MSHVYAVGDMSYRRHITNDGSETLCGMPAGQHEPLALPVTCDACRTANGRLTRERMAAEAPAPAFAKGDRVWLKNAAGGVMTYVDWKGYRREVEFRVKDVVGTGELTRYILDTHDSEARRRYCGPVGTSAESLTPAEA